MRQGIKVIGLILFLFATALAGEFRLSENNSGVAVPIQELAQTVLDIKIGSLDYESDAISNDRLRITLPDAFAISRGAYLGPGDAVMPTITRLIAVPIDADPTFAIIKSSSQTLSNIHIAPAIDEDIAALSIQQGGALRGQTPPLVRGEIAGVLRDLKLYAITISPVEYNPETSSLTVYDDIEIEVAHNGSRPTQFGNTISEAFAPVYKALVDNPQLFDPIAVTRGAYWIIYPDAFVSNIQPLVDWKTAKGFKVSTIPKSAFSANSATAIKSYILTRFDTCTVKPDYIVIVGDVTMPSSYGIATRPYSNPNGDGDSDNFYTFLYGNDYFPDVFIGRISIDNISELSAYTNKLFTYERTPYMANTGWYHRATTVAGSDGGSFVSPRLTKLWVREMMIDSGFTQVDTFFDDWSGQITPAMINASINNGVCFVNYRGYGYADSWIPPNYSVSDLNALTNVNRYGIMTSIVCATGDFNDVTDVCFGEAWIRMTNKGGAGFIGNSNHYAHTRWTNAIDVGIYWGWFAEGVATLAQGELMGKMNLYYAFPNNRESDGQVDLYFNTYNDLGDPEINIWTDIPQEITANYPDSIVFGQNSLTLQVLSGGLPLEGAAVCIWKGNEIHDVGFTDDAGNIEFQASPLTPGELKLTITAQGHIPIEDSIAYYENDFAVSYLDHTLSDDNIGESLGDGDGTINPSETIELNIKLKNYGLNSANGVTCTISDESDYFALVRSSATYGIIAPADSALGNAPFLLHVNPDATHNAKDHLLLTITDNDGHTWQGLAILEIKAASLEITSVLIDDHGGNGQFNRGETVDFILTAENTGSKAINTASAVLRSHDSHVRVTDSTAVFGDCLPGNSFGNGSDHFIVSCDSAAINGHMINFEIDFAGQGPQLVSTSFNQQIGAVTSSDPFGPDDYGYYCIDNTDTSYADHPTFSWIDISTGWTYVSIGDDDYSTISLPFNVTYYGEVFNQVTLTDNGFAALGSTWFNNFFNSQIPGPQNPKAMLGPFWDDFVMTTMRVYYHYDTVNNWFIIGWRNVTVGSSGLAQTFEIIIYDTNFWPTRTGDNDIVFQYNLVQSPTTCAIGICSPDRNNGLQYLFDDNYTAGAPELLQGRAIKFTTGMLQQGCQYITGDINGNGVANGIDVTYGVTYFKGGTEPPIACDCGVHGTIFAGGDANGNCVFNGIDITYYVAYLKGGAVLNSCPDCPPAAQLHIPASEIEEVINYNQLKSGVDIAK
jgi:hypothetical protein